MSMVRPSYTPEFKLEVCERIESGGTIAGLARELGVRRATLFKWRTIYRAKGSAGLRGRGRPPTPTPVAPASAGPEPAPARKAGAADPARRIAELERKIGQQALELDFFRAALQHVRAARR